MKFQPSTPQKLTLDQIVEILAADRDGIRVQLTAQRLGVKSGTIYAWIARYSGLDAKGFHLIRKIERENKRLRSDVARAESRSRIAIEVIKQLEPSSRKRAWMTPHLQKHFAVDRKLANEVLSIGADATGRRPLPQPTEHLVAMMKHYLAENPGHGLATMYQAVLRGTPGGIARARKAYHEAGLSVRQRSQRKAKLPRRVLRPMEIQGGPDRVWSMDFMLHALSDGTPFRILNVIDDFNREAIACRALPTHTTVEVVDALDQVAKLGRLPGCIRTDNGTEFKSLAYRNWTDAHNVLRSLLLPRLREWWTC